jgi:hypothetical protein
MNRVIAVTLELLQSTLRADLAIEATLQNLRRMAS